MAHGKLRTPNAARALDGVSSGSLGLRIRGTEPAAIFVSHNGALSWRECPEVARLRDEHGWMLPYSPQAGCVRGFTLHGTRAYAAVEVGGALRSDDGGTTWQVTSDGLHVPWRRHMVERFEQVGNELFAVLSNGELLVTHLAPLQWKRVLAELDDVHAVTSMKQ